MNVNMVNKYIKKITTFYVTLILLLGVWGHKLHSAPTDSNSPRPFKNITRSSHLLEVKPRFIENDKSVLYLVFCGDTLSPKPWDYRLSKSDRDGNSFFYLTQKGVLDYNVLPNEQGIIVLKVDPSSKFNNFENKFYEQIQDWELWYYNLQGGERVLLEESNCLPLSVGFSMLGLGAFPDLDSEEYLITSPQKTEQFVIQKERVQDANYFKYYQLGENDEEQAIFETEIWNSYSDLNWWPTIIWLNENTILTTKFSSEPETHFPQSKGWFSIVKINLKIKSQEILYEDHLLNPFPKFVLNPMATDLYFQRLSEDKNITELWKINLLTKVREQIYEVNGELGEARFSLDGSSLVLTQLRQNNFDIIRLDLNPNGMHQIADK